MAKDTVLALRKHSEISNVRPHTAKTVMSSISAMEEKALPVLWHGEP